MTSRQPARALWVTQAGTAEIRASTVSEGHDLVSVRTLWSGISRGTERLVFRGEVPPSEHETMRAPFQEGDFCFPVKYGYAAVGLIEDGERAGQIVFSLHPHQTRFAVPQQAALPVPPSVPARRAGLAANMETALNILWDAEVRPGDRVVVVGAGVVGALAGYLCARIPGTEVCLVDIDPKKGELASALGCAFALPTKTPEEADRVIHASASSEGLATAIAVAGLEATIAEASWYGTRATTVPLGAEFHRKRLRIVGSQVGRVPTQMAPRWSYRRRLSKALDLLSDPAVDCLISGETTFDDLAGVYGDILMDPATLCHLVRYSRP